MGGRVLRQYNEAGVETPSSDIPFAEVVRASVVPRVFGLPRHDLLLDPNKGEALVRRFGRGFLKDRGRGAKLEEYLHCLVTNKYRLWVSSVNGQALVTHQDYEVYL